MSLPFVYRIQDAEGRGPFRPGLSAKWRDAAGNDFPAMLPKGELPEGFTFGYACRSLDELNQWFSRAERRRLRRLGFDVVCVRPVVVVSHPNEIDQHPHVCRASCAPHVTVQP